MALDRFLIAPINTGLETDKRPWIIPDDAFAYLENSYVFRGRVVKRLGSMLMGGTNDPNQSRLRVNIGTIMAGNTTISVNVPGAKFLVGQMFTIGTDVFTVYQTGTPANMLVDSLVTVTTATFDTTTGAVDIVYAAPLGSNTTVYWYPSQPVMGLTQFLIGLVNDHPTYAFDTQFAYVYTGSTGWQRSQSGGNPVFTGNYQQFFWTANFVGASFSTTTLFVTNFNQTLGAGPTGDPMWYFDGTTWTMFEPVFLTDGSFVATAKIIVPFKNRLLLLNTIEQSAAGVNTQYPFRLRYSHYGSPVTVNAFLEPKQTYMAVTGDGGNFLDASTEEQIITAGFIKDRLIVYFERSTWEIIYTGNQVNPFAWQKINAELGSQSTFSPVIFDTQLLAIGNTGVHACSGSNVQRIDEKIPNVIFDDFVTENNATIQTAGIRDYKNELAYWSYVSQTDRFYTQLFPNRMLVYNYRNNSWAFFDDTFTAYGYFEQTTDLTWAEAVMLWEEATFTWASNIEIANQRQVIAGNQQGFVLILDSKITRNAPSLSITNMTNAGQLTVINHNLVPGDYIVVENAAGISTYNNNIYQIDVLDANNILLYTPSTGTYRGDGTIARVSNIDIQTKQFNPYDKQGRDVYIQKIDFLVDRTANGYITVDYYPSTSELSMLEAGEATGAILGTGALQTSAYPTVTIEQNQVRLWHPLFFQVSAESIQLNFYLTDAQIRNPDIAFSDFQLHAMLLHTRPTSARLQ